MKLYRRDLEINKGVEMHLTTTHYLTPIEITEDDIWEILDEFGESDERMGGYIYSWGLIAKKIIQKLKGE